MGPEATFAIRSYEPDDEEAVVALSIRAWAPVFASMESILGRELSVRLHGDWRVHQAKVVREALAKPGITVWVAEQSGSGSGPGVVGFVAAWVADPERKLGEVYILAVDPAAQVRGVGTALTAHATEWLRGAGMRVAMIKTGGDPGHAPARRVYEKADYTQLPEAGYYKAL